ncbi:hypothetical protein [Aerosticca soli]|uniref:hypothetical protein n=1 Tax=Aerosticca soli TaxID=2010829 RepID=UPI000F84AF9B|nr:hypothetical protein [Aerosticca soli]
MNESLLQMACDAADLDTTTGICTHPVWIHQQGLLPELDASSGVAVSVAILACWATAYVYRVLRRAGD